jgi:hypothetical protein
MGSSPKHRDEEEAKEFALLLMRQQQLEQTPEIIATTEGLLDTLRQHHVMIDDHDDEDDDDEAVLEGREAALSGMSISYDRQEQLLARPSSTDTTSLDDTLMEEEDEIMPGRSMNSPPTSLQNAPKSSTTAHRSALALFWEGGLLYTVCLVLPTMLHWLLYDDAGNLWVTVAYNSTRDAFYSGAEQWAVRAHDVVCAHMNCPDWQRFAQEQWDPVVEYLCASDEIDPFGFYGVRSYETKVQDYVSPFYWAHRLGLCPIAEVEEVVPPLPVVSPDITGWEHDIQIIFALGLVLTILRLVVGLLLTEWSPPLETDRAIKVEQPKTSQSTEPLYLQVVVRVPSDQFRSDEPANTDIVVSPTEETERVVNNKQRSRRLVLNKRDVDDQSAGAYSERSQSSRSVRSTRSIRSAMSATNRRMRGLRNRMFKGKQSSRSSLLGSTDSVSCRTETNVEFENTGEHQTDDAHRPQEQITSANSSLSEELPDANDGMNPMNDSMDEDPQRHVWVGSVQAGGSPGRASAHRASPPSPTASLDSSISTKHDLRPGSGADRNNTTWSLEQASIPEKAAPVLPRGRQPFVAEPQVDVTELFLLLCSMVAVTQAWFSLRDSNFWPRYVGGHGNTANCWDLSGGLSVGMDSDFDHRNAVLKQYFLGQASFHWYSATLHLLGMLLSQWQRCVAPKNTEPRNETVASVPMAHGRDLVQHVLVLVIFAVAFIFSSLRRLVAIGVFAFDASKLCLHFYGTLSSNRATMGMAREMYWCLVLPSFVVARFAIWPALWYSATFESSDWLTQLDQTLWPGAADTFRVSCHVGMFLLLLVSLLDLRRKDLAGTKKCLGNYS